MLTLLSALGSLLSFQVRSRTALELELVDLRHQVTVLRRQRPGRPRLLFADRLLWVWLYRIWPQVLDAIVLVKPATVVQWHRKGFRLYWRRRSRHLGRPRVSREIRDLIRKMSLANPLWGAPRIHGELLKLGIDVSQATVGRYLPWRPKVPSPTWRSFLHNHMHDTAAVDMFVVVTARFLTMPWIRPRARSAWTMSRMKSRGSTFAVASGIGFLSFIYLSTSTRACTRAICGQANYNTAGAPAGDAGRPHPLVIEPSTPVLGAHGSAAALLLLVPAGGRRPRQWSLIP